MAWQRTVTKQQSAIHQSLQFFLLDRETLMEFEVPKYFQ